MSEITDASSEEVKTTPITILKLILMVEDDVDDIEIFTEALQSVSPEYTLVCKHTAVEAGEFLNSLAPEEYPCLIILDYNVPITSGVEYLRILQADERFRHIPMAIYTTSTLSDHRAEAEAFGAKVFLNKQSKLELIQEDVRQLVSYCL